MTGRYPVAAGVQNPRGRATLAPYSQESTMASLRGASVLLAVIAIDCGSRSLDPGPPDGGGGTGGSGIVVGDGGPDTVGPIDGPRSDRYIPELTCGNGVVDPGEQCDDNNRIRGDGCSPICQIECFSSCGRCGPPGTCIVTHRCGDGALGDGEICDDGNMVAGDGCSDTCRAVEPGWRCLVAGMRCVPICGDGRIGPPETCDDGNTVAGDGCSEFCLLEPSTARCGDGVLSGAEECDDGPRNGDVGYGSCTTRCQIAGTCGDGVRNGPEDCDDGPQGNNVTYGNMSGCAPGCRFPHFCGDAIVDTDEGEQCDLGPLNGSTEWICFADCKIPI
jgi:cysteine-rich repeat protein